MAALRKPKGKTKVQQPSSGKVETGRRGQAQQRKPSSPKLAPRKKKKLGKTEKKRRKPGENRVVGSDEKRKTPVRRR